MSSNTSDEKVDQKNSEKKLTNKDLRKVYARWIMGIEVSNSYERLQALSFNNALAKTLKTKLYKDDSEGLREALLRNIQFYNSEGIFGSIIVGATLSMEEEKSKGKPIEGEVITGFKTGLMGPIAGIGDTLIHGTLKPIILGIGASLAMSEVFIGGLVPFLYPLLTIILGYWFLKTGYTLGKESVMKMMKSGLVNKVIESASVLGLFMMGALASTYIKVETPLKIPLEEGDPIVVQDILDDILHGLLPLSAVLGIYFYFKYRGQYYNRLIVWLIVISLITGFFGILSVD